MTRDGKCGLIDVGYFPPTSIKPDKPKIKIT